MKLFKESIILTKRHNRYAGDCDSVLGLVFDYKGYVYLYSDSEKIYGTDRLFSITSCPRYGQWLLDNAMDLLRLAYDDNPNEFYDDRNGDDNGRKREFLNILSKL